MNSKFTREEVTNIIIDWAERKAKDKEIEFDKNFSVHTDDRDTIRYRTKELTKRFPDNPKGIKKGWSLHRYLEPYPHYFYEIDCSGKELQLKLAIHKNIIMPITSKNKCDTIMEHYTNYEVTPEPKGTSYRIPCIFSHKINNCKNEKDIRNEMDKLYYQMKGYESCILNNIRKE